MPDVTRVLRELSDVGARAVLDAMSIPVQVTDSDGNVIYYGGSSEAVFGYPAEEIIGRNILEFTPPEHAHRALESLGDLAISEVVGIAVPTVYPIICADGSLTWQAVAAVPMLDHPEVQGIVFYYLPWDAQLEFDNTVTSLLEGDSLDVVLGRLALAIAVHFEAVAAGVHHGFDGVAFEGAIINGLPPSCVIDDARSPWHRAAAESRSVYAVADDVLTFVGPQARSAMGKAQIGGVWAIPVTMDEGAEPAVLSIWRTSPMEPVTAHDFVTARSLSYTRLVLTRWSERETLEFLATSDTLTGLANRARFTAVVENALDDGEQMVVLFCDVDRFKGVNDDLGHHAGDAILAEVARRLRAMLDPGDLLARIGGDEFTAMHLGDLGSAEAMASRMVAAVARPFEVGGHKIDLGLSVGIASSEPGVRFSDLLRRADVALYRSKAAGGGRVTIADT